MSARWLEQEPEDGVQMPPRMRQAVCVLRAVPWKGALLPQPLPLPPHLSCPTVRAC